MDVLYYRENSNFTLTSVYYGIEAKHDSDVENCV